MTPKKLYIILFLVFVTIFYFSLFSGVTDISIKDVFYMMIGQTDKVDTSSQLIISEIRLPRIVLAFLIGMMLTSSGVVTQAVFQNPLADPYIIGIAASATFGAVLGYLFKIPPHLYGVVAFIVCLNVSFLIFKLSKTSIRVNVTKLLMIGIAISAFLGAFTSFSIYLIGEDSFQIILWTMGYLGYASWDQVLVIIPPFALAMLYFYIKRYDLDLILSGDEEAHALGVNVPRLKKYVLIVSSLVVGFSVAFTGMIGFVGLIIPHCIRLLIGSSHIKLIPLATIFGGVFLLLCDTIARLIIAPVEIPIGVVTAFFGAPFFLYLAMRAK